MSADMISDAENMDHTISDTAASAVNSLMPAPAPAIVMPPMKTFMVWAVLATIMPMMMKAAPTSAM